MTGERLKELQDSNYRIMSEIEAQMVLDVMFSSDVQNLAWSIVFGKNNK